MNAVDVILIVGVVLATLRGWRIGLLMSLVSLLAILLAYIAALAYGGQVAEQLAGGSVDRGSAMALVGFALVFLMTLLVCYTLGRVLHTVGHHRYPGNSKAYPGIDPRLNLLLPQELLQLGHPQQIESLRSLGNSYPAALLAGR